MATDQWTRLNELERKRIMAVSDKDIHKTQLVVCERAKDAADAGYLLAALGIHPKRVRIPQGQVTV